MVMPDGAPDATPTGRVGAVAVTPDDIEALLGGAPRLDLAEYLADRAGRHSFAGDRPASDIASSDWSTR